LQISLLVSRLLALVVGIFSLRSQKQIGFSGLFQRPEFERPPLCFQWDQAVDEEDNEEWGTRLLLWMGKSAR
jgi:hypothetical protein